jgi:hypothetical protein
MDLAYSQYPIRSHTQNAQIQHSPEQVLVQETPANTDASLTQEETYQYTQYPDESSEHYVPAAEQSSIFVNETPPEGQVRHARAPVGESLSCPSQHDHCVEESSQEWQIDDC